MQTILITGSSSRFGRDTARVFLDRGWRVIATMRTPRPDVLPPSDRLRVLPLDVTRAESVETLAEAAGPVEALVNNAASASSAWSRAPRWPPSAPRSRRTPSARWP